MSRSRLTGWVVALCIVATVGISLPTPHATAAPYTDYYTERLRGTRADLYIAEVNGGAVLFTEVNPGNICRDAMHMIRWDGRDATGLCVSLRRVGDDLVKSEEYPRTVRSGRFEDDTVTLDLEPNWLRLPLGYTERIVLRKATFDGWLTARDRITEARAVRQRAIVTVTPRSVGSYAAAAGSVAININLGPLRATQTTLGGDRALFAGANRAGIWVLDAAGIKLRTGAQFVTRTIDQPWRYPNPSGPGTRYTAFSESGDGRTRIYWRWLEGGTLERDGEAPVALPPGQYSLSRDGRWLASYPGIDSNRPDGVPRNVSVTRLSVMNLDDRVAFDYSGNLRYTAYRGHEDWGYQPPTPQWSPSSTYVAYRDWDADRSYVVNVRTGARVDVGAGTPQWSRLHDILLIADDEAARLLDASTGLIVELPRGPRLNSQIYTYYFDMSGMFVVRSGIALSDGSDVPQTTAFDVRTGREVVQWQCAQSDSNPEWRATDGAPPLGAAAAYGDTPIFAATGYQGCTSLLVHHPALPGGELCFELGSFDVGIAWSPDGRHFVSGGYVVDVLRREAVYLGVSSYSALWSPDSGVVAFGTGDRTRIYAPATREQLELRTSARPAFWYGRALIMNPSSN